MSLTTSLHSCLLFQSCSDVPCLQRKRRYNFEFLIWNISLNDHTIAAIWANWNADLIVAREFAASVVLPESTRWWITGGTGGDGTALRETEIYENGVFRIGPNLPKG